MQKKTALENMVLTRLWVNSKKENSKLLYLSIESEFPIHIHPNVRKNRKYKMLFFLNRPNKYIYLYISLSYLKRKYTP